MVTDKGREEGVFPSSVPPLSRQEVELAVLQSCPQGRAAHLHLPHPGPALLYCPGKVQGWLSQGWQQMKGRDRYPLVILLGSSSSAFQERSGKREGRGSLLVEATTQQTRDRAGSPTRTLSLTCNPHIVGQLYSAAQARLVGALLRTTGGEGQESISPCWLWV